MMPADAHCCAENTYRSVSLLLVRTRPRRWEEASPRWPSPRLPPALADCMEAPLSRFRTNYFLLVLPFHSTVSFRRYGISKTYR